MRNRLLFPIDDDDATVESSNASTKRRRRTRATSASKVVESMPSKKAAKSPATKSVDAKSPGAKSPGVKSTGAKSTKVPPTKSGSPVDSADAAVETSVERSAAAATEGPHETPTSPRPLVPPDSMAASDASASATGLDERIENPLIRASAGTGKTYQLTSRYLRLLFLGALPETILATTFTRKAAGEILDRVVLWLAKAATDDTDRVRLAEAVRLPELTQLDCQQKLSLLTRQLHRLRIETMDAFFMQMALSFSLELGLTPGWGVVEDGPESTSLRNEAIAGVLRQESLDDLLVLLHQLSPKGDARRGLDGMLHDRVQAAYRLFLDSTPEAWDQLEVPPPLADDVVDEIRQSLANYAGKGTIIPQAVRADADRIVHQDWRGFFQSGSTLARRINEGREKYGSAKIPPELLSIYRRFLPHLRAMTLQSASAQTRGTCRFLAKYHEQFQRVKNRLRLCEFDEVTSLLAAQAGRDGSLQFSFRMDAGIDHLLLDEFQDTSIAQWMALESIALRATEPTPGRSFFCVGDVKQAIYGWRGGTSEIFNLLDQKLPNLKNFQLQESRRSAPVVMDIVNRVFQLLPEWEPTKLGRAARAAKRWEFVEHTTHRQELPGYVSLETSDVATSLLKEDQETQVFRRAAERVAAMSLQARGRSIGILCRTNAKVGQMMNELQRLGVSASEEGGNFLTDSAAVELILSLLHLTDHPADSVAAYHLARSPWAAQLGLAAGVCDHYGVESGKDVDTSEDATKLADDRASTEASPDSTRRPPGGIDPQAIYALVRRIRNGLLNDGFGVTLQRLVTELWPFCNRREGRRLTQLVEKAYEYQFKIESPAQLGYEYQRRQSLRPTDFVRFIRETKVADPSSDAIRVMTVHQAKGLEFDIVVLPDLLFAFVDGHDAFLHRRPTVDGPIDLVCRYMGKDTGRSFLPDDFMPLFDQWEDQRARDAFCVLYVALTRAVHALHLFVPCGLQQMRFPRGNAAYLVKDALLPKVKLEPAQTMFEAGDSQWFLQDPPEETDMEVSKSLPEPRLAASRRRRNLETIAPSQIGQSSYVATGDRLGRVADSARDQARSLGSLVHLWLSQIEWLDGGAIPVEESLLLRVALPFADKLDVGEALERFRAQIQLEPLNQVLDQRQYRVDLASSLPDLPSHWECEVRREQPVAGRDEHSIISGIVDRLVLVKSGGKVVAAEVIDFKTASNANVDGPDNRVDRYEAQMSAYRRVIAGSLRIPSGLVSSRLVML